MADMTVTWKGAVPMDALGADNTRDGVQVLGPSEYKYGQAQLFHSGSLEASMQESVPYMGTDEAEFDWADEFVEAKKAAKGK